MSNPKKLKARHPTVKRKSQSPMCPLHGMAMEFKVEELLWECPSRGCSQVAFPKTEASKGKPILGRGEVELFVMTDPKTKKTHYLLRSADNNVMIDVTSVMPHEPEFRSPGSDLVHLTVAVPYVDGR